MRVLMVTSEWPTADQPASGVFIAQQVDFLRRAGVDVEVFAFRGARRITRYAAAFGKLRRTWRAGHFDLVHAQFGHSGALAMLATGGPWVVTFHGSDVFGIAQDGGYHPASPVLRGLSRVAAWRSHEAVVVSRRMLTCLPPRNYHVLPMGLDLACFAPVPRAQARTTLGLDPQQPLVLFGGNTHKAVKRYALAQAVMEHLPAALNARLVVVENQTHETVALYMNACDALLLTSMHEGSPNVVKEALACNLPVVTVNVGDVKERLSGISGCVVCDSDAPGPLSTALAEVLQQSQRCAGRATVAHLDEKLLTEKLITIYHSALMGPRTTHQP